MSRLATWWRSHEGWIAAGVLSIGMFGAGWIAGTLALRSDYIDETTRLSAAYQASNDAKDHLIQLLATGAIKATLQANDAAATANDAASTANDAAAKASRAVDTAKTLKGLK